LGCPPWSSGGLDELDDHGRKLVRVAASVGKQCRRASEVRAREVRGEKGERPSGGKSRSMERRVLSKLSNEEGMPQREAHDVLQDRQPSIPLGCSICPVHSREKHTPNVLFLPLETSEKRSVASRCHGDWRLEANSSSGSDLDNLSRSNGNVVPSEAASKKR
jgi:hypothetical protein